ncbi:MULTISPECIES: hypothetical protein [Demequina]|uniref:hypothetical protein n=1 Tax=Demequina TaxID=577469 RepID=UPI000780A140|nr:MULTISPECIES: hypothetical protein [Demequina]
MPTLTPWTARPAGPLDPEDRAAIAVASLSKPARLADSVDASTRPKGPARMTPTDHGLGRPAPALTPTRTPAHDEPLPVLVGVPGHLG